MPAEIQSWKQRALGRESRLRVPWAWFVLVFLVCSVMGDARWRQHLFRHAFASSEQPVSVVALPYMPPLDSEPGYSQRSGTSRGVGDISGPTVLVLAPDHIGVTVHEQPVLYWYISQATRYPVELTLIGLDSPEPLLTAKLNPPFQPGVRRVRLADYGIRLEPGIP